VPPPHISDVTAFPKTVESSEQLRTVAEQKILTTTNVTSREELCIVPVRLASCHRSSEVMGSQERYKGCLVVRQLRATLSNSAAIANLLNETAVYTCRF